MPTLISSDAAYTFEGIRHPVTKRDVLWLEPEPNFSTISDDYDLDHPRLFGIWAEEVRRKDAFDKRLGAPWVSVYWTVRGGETCETAPFQEYGWENFLTYFTWPVDDDGERLNWLALPVRPNGKTGSYIERATAWVPSALQLVVNLDLLELAAR